MSHNPEDLGELAKLLNQNGLRPERIRRINGARVARWEVVTKERQEDGTDETKVTELTGSSVSFDPVVGEETFTRQAPPVRITPTKRKAPIREYNLGLIIPDIQLPYANQEAMDYVANEALKMQPNQIIVLGDAVDFAALSTHQERDPKPEFMFTTQQCIDGLHRYLAQLRCNAPNAVITLISGNHEDRLMKYIRRNAKEVLGLRRAGEDLGVLTLEFLLRLNELEIAHVAGYPNGEYWITDNLKAVHGDTSASNGSTAHRMLQRHDSSVIFGHTHRIEMAYQTVQQRRGQRYKVAASVGTLANLDGTVPSERYARDERDNNVRYAPNWQLGFGWVAYTATSHEITPVHLGNVL